jgi:hypothetical protein
MGGTEENSMSVYDDGTDLGESPPLPAEEHRGGEAIGWDAVQPGQPLPGKAPDPEARRAAGETLDPRTGQWSG